MSKTISIPISGRLTSLLLLLGSSFANTLMASPVVTGSVSLDAMTGLYDYSYTIDNTGGPGNVTQLYLQVNSIGGADFYPTSYSSPAGWTFSVGWFAGSSCTLFGECGGFWSWQTPNGSPNGLPSGQTLGGFSFETAVAPSTSVANHDPLYYPYFPMTPCSGTSWRQTFCCPDRGLNPSAPRSRRPTGLFSWAGRGCFLRRVIRLTAEIFLGEKCKWSPGTSRWDASWYGLPDVAMTLNNLGLLCSDTQRLTLAGGWLGRGRG